MPALRSPSIHFENYPLVPKIPAFLLVGRLVGPLRRHGLVSRHEVFITLRVNLSSLRQHGLSVRAHEALMVLSLVEFSLAPSDAPLAARSIHGTARLDSCTPSASTNLSPRLFHLLCSHRSVLRAAHWCGRRWAE